MVEVQKKDVRKLLVKKVHQLNDILADLDGLLTQMETDFFRVCIFGSARITEDSPFYTQVYDLAKALSSQGVDVVTGGGPGLMEAANKGAKEGANQSRSIGLPIDLPFETDANSHLDVKRQHRRFSSRLDEFMRISHAVVMTAGGIGTCLEFLYTWQLLQVGHIKPRPVLLLGKKFWEGFLKWFEEEPIRLALMSRKDMEMFVIVDSVEEVMKHLEPVIVSFRNGESKQSLPGDLQR